MAIFLSPYNLYKNYFLTPKMYIKMKKRISLAMSIIVVLSVLLIIIDLKSCISGENISLRYRLVVSEIAIVSLALTIKNILK